MSGEDVRRGGTEPLAALVSVAVVCLAVSVYTGFASEVIWDPSEEQTDRATLDSVWSTLSENGVLDASDPVAGRLDPGALPRGHRVAVSVTVVGDDGRLDTVGAATFGTGGASADVEPPPAAAVSDRPVPVRVGPGDVRPGRLTVVVWDG